MERGIEGALKGLCEKDWWKRKRALESLVSYPEEHYVESLERWLRDGEDALLRNASIEAFKALGKRALGTLRRLLKDEDEEVRMFAAIILGEAGEPEVMGDLVSALRDPSVNVRVSAAEALGKLGEERALDDLKGAAEDVPWVAMAALQAIGAIGGGKAEETLLSFLPKREYLIVTLGALEESGQERSLLRLKELVSDGEAGEQALVSAVAIARRLGKRLPPEYFSHSLGRVLEMVESNDPKTRNSAFIALTWAENINGIDLIIDGIEDEEVQEHALSGLLALGKKAVPSVVEALRASRHANRALLAKALSMAGENMALLQFADDYDPEVRAEVAIAMRGLKTSSAIGHLLKMLDDPYEEVREAARRSLDGRP